jgi:ferredoxin
VKIATNREVCRGHGQCELFAPGVFTVDDDALVVLRADEIDAADEGAVNEAILHCPESAIWVERS